MNKNRLEAFSDGVMAIIITIMVLELKVPHGTEYKDIEPLFPAFLAYVLSFIYVGIYWNNHHHLLQPVKHVNGKILWANLFLLFALSLLPFATGWMGENHLDGLPVLVYGLVLFLASIAWLILIEFIIREKGNDKIAQSLAKDMKIRKSSIIYAIAIAIALFIPWVSCVIYALVALYWFIPDKRMERVMKDDNEQTKD